MRRKRRWEPRVCVCQQGHLEGLARATVRRKGELVEPGPTVAVHHGACVHSDLERTTNGKSPETVKRVHAPRRKARRLR